MASTFSPNLRLELIGTGEQQGTWGTTTNTNLGTLLEEAIGGYVSVAVSDVADTTLTTNNGSADQSRNMVINLTGSLTGTRNVICPAIEKLYVVKNATTGSQSIVFKVSGQTGVTIPNGSTYLLYVDGTDVRQITGSIAGQNANNVAITGGSITGITDLAVADGGTGASNASSARTNLGIGTIGTQDSNNVTITGGSISGITDLSVADGGTGSSSFTAYSVLVGGTTSTNPLQSLSSVGTSGQVLTSQGSSAVPIWQDVSGTPTGSVIPFAGLTEPSGWLFCYGQSVSRTTYASLFAALSKNATVTITIATPGVITWTSHGLVAGDPVTFNTTGALPTGITAGTTYYVISTGLTADAFQISATLNGAAVNTSGTQSGTHTAYNVPYGVASATNFNLPDLRGRAVAGKDNMGGTSANRLTGLSGGVNGDILGAAGGLETHTLVTAEIAAHQHFLFKNTTTNVVSPTISNTQYAAGTNVTGGQQGYGIQGTASSADVGLSSSTGGDGAHNNVQPTSILNYIIKT